MISARAERCLRELAAEGVQPWLVPASSRTPDIAAVRRRFGGLSLPRGVPLDAVRAACDGLLDVPGAPGPQWGFVAVAVAVEPPSASGPRPGPESGPLVAAARMVCAGVDRPNLLVRLPATRAGRAAAAACLAEGIGVQSTGVHSAEHYAAVLDAHLAGLERALARGVDVAGVATAASCPVGPLDAAVNARLDRLPGGAGRALRDTAGQATARLLHRTREERLCGARWRALRAAGARPPMLVWTGTGPAHVPALVGWNTVHALTLDTLEAAAERGGLGGDTLLGRHRDAERVLRDLADLGVRAASGCPDAC
ncbi:transaldolase family protein [Streptomyces sp. NPDC045431]|uniref:transaldolase family protein n=1 Tax=Streptomyces sp. NPDC045431 TaxID=3155613 RepID=UPI0033FF78C8